MIHFNNIQCHVTSYENKSAYSATYVHDWTKASISSINRYCEILGELLDNTVVTTGALRLYSAGSKHLIDDYYVMLITSIQNASRVSIPYLKRCSNDFVVVLGWNEVVKDKHSIARAVFLDWVADGKPRNGHTFMIMSRTRASFKLALRYCRKNEDMLCADARAKIWQAKIIDFWRSISKFN